MRFTVGMFLCLSALFAGQIGVASDFVWNRTSNEFHSNGGYVTNSNGISSYDSGTDSLGPWAYSDEIILNPDSQSSCQVLETTMLARAQSQSSFDSYYQLDQLVGSGGNTSGDAQIVLTWDGPLGGGHENYLYLFDVIISLGGQRFMHAYIIEDGYVVIEYWSDSESMVDSATSTTTVFDPSGSVGLIGHDLEFADGQEIRISGNSWIFSESGGLVIDASVTVD